MKPDGRGKRDMRDFPNISHAMSRHQITPCGECHARVTPHGRLQAAEEGVAHGNKYTPRRVRHFLALGADMAGNAAWLPTGGWTGLSYGLPARRLVLHQLRGTSVSL